MHIDNLRVDGNGLVFVADGDGNLNSLKFNTPVDYRATKKLQPVLEEPEFNQGDRVLVRGSDREEWQNRIYVCAHLDNFLCESDSDDREIVRWNQIKAMPKTMQIRGHEINKEEAKSIMMEIVDFLNE